MRAFVINLDRANDRWAHVEASFAKTQFKLTRIPAVDGNAISLPNKDYAEKLYRWFHGRETNRYELACYLSHVQAMKTFLTTGEEHALICEDDIILRPELDEVVEAALQRAPFWNILRLTALTANNSSQVARLSDETSLCVCLGRTKGTGAYLIDRRAAAALVANLLPMRLPYDHALDREWFFGLAAASVNPFPISQTDTKFKSSIQGNSQRRLSPLVRWLGTYPYQIVNEVSRWIFRGCYLISLKVRLSRRATIRSSSS